MQLGAGLLTPDELTPDDPAAGAHDGGAGRIGVVGWLAVAVVEVLVAATAVTVGLIPRSGAGPGELPAPPGAAPLQPADPGRGWRPVWSDEFDGTTIDRTKWNLRPREWRDVDRGCNTDSPRNAFVAGGLLTLRALRERTPCGRQVREYSQAYLDTIGVASWTYGRFEMRARSPNRPGASTGLWPAFWLRPDDAGQGEIDVVELPGGDAWQGAVTHAIFLDYTPVKQEKRGWPWAGGFPGDGFHTYACEWEPGELRWYVDGRLVWRRDRGTTPWFDTAFAKPYNLRLNFQVGGWLGEPDAATTFPADFVVDYVRVWQR